MWVVAVQSGADELLDIVGPYMTEADAQEAAGCIEDEEDNDEGVWAEVKELVTDYAKKPPAEVYTQDQFLQAMRKQQ